MTLPLRASKSSAFFILPFLLRNEAIDIIALVRTRRRFAEKQIGGQACKL
jgi:hypothetical protein